MLADKDRIFTNLYGLQSPGLDAGSRFNLLQRYSA